MRLFTIRIKFCLVPTDPKNTKKNRKKYVEQFFWKNVENRQKNVEKCWKSLIFNLFSIFFSTYFFQVFFGFLGSAITKQNFILMVKSQFPKWFDLQKGKRNMQKQHLLPEILRFLDVTFSSLEAKPLRKLTFHHKDKILLSSCRP